MIRNREVWSEQFLQPLRGYCAELPEDLEQVSQAITTVLDQINHPDFQAWRQAEDAEEWRALLVETQDLCGQIMEQLMVARGRIQSKLRQLDKGKAGLAGYKVAPPPGASEFDTES